MGNKSTRSTTRSPSTSSATNTSTITRDLIRAKSEDNPNNDNVSENEAIATLLQLLILSEVLDIDSSDDEEDEDQENDKNAEQNVENYNLSQTVIQSLVKGDEEAIKAMKIIRKRVKKGNQKSFNEEMERKIITCLVNFLKQHNKNSLLMNSLKTLRKISAKTKIRLSTLNSTGLGPVITQLLISKLNDDSICFSALTVVSNIASDSDDSRQHLLNSGILEPIIKCCEPTDGLLSRLKLDQASNALLTLCTIEYKPQNFNQIQSCIRCLVTLLENQNNEEVSAKASITLSLIFNNTEEGKNFLINQNILIKLQKNFFTDNECLLKASCVVLQKICEKLLSQMDLYLDQTLVNQIKLLMTTHESIKMRTLLNFTIGNIIQMCHIHDVNSVLDLFIDEELCHHLGYVLNSKDEEYTISGVGLIQCIFGGNYDMTRDHFEELFMSGEYQLLPQMIRRFDSFKDKNEELMIFLKALMNMASDGDYCRDKLLNFGLMDKLIDVMRTSLYSCIQTKSICVMKQLCNFSTIPPEFDSIKSCIPVIREAIRHPDPEVVVEAVRTVANVAKSSLEAKQAIVDLELGPTLVHLMIHEDSGIASAAIAALVHLSFGSSGSFQQTLNINPYPILFELLLSNEEMTVTRVCLSLQVIMISNVDHIQEAIDANIFSVLISLMNNATFDIKIRAMNTVCQAISAATPNQINSLVDEGLIGALSAISFIEEEDDAIKLLNSFRSVLRVGEIFADDMNERNNLFSLMVAESGGLESILNQRWRENQTISQIASEIISRYYPELDSENYKPVVKSSEPKPSTSQTNFDSNNVNECQICFSRPRNCLFLPCRHVFMCIECNRDMISIQSENQTLCPICRTKIETSIEMIMS